MNGPKTKEVNYSSVENMVVTYNIMNKMRKQHVLCDLNIKIGSTIMAVHKIVLASNSEYFNKMFTSDFKESHENEITINEVEPEALEHLVEYAYTSKLKITEQNVQGILVASNFLLFDDNIISKCLKFIKDIVDAENCFKFKDFAYLNDIGELQKYCNSFMLENFCTISISSQFLLLPFDQIFELIQSEHINTSEVKIYESIMLWVKHDLNNRLNSLQKLMKCIRMSLIPASYFMNHIENENILKANCKELLYETLKLYSSEHAKCNKFCNQRRNCSSEQFILFIACTQKNFKCTLNWISTKDELLCVKTLPLERLISFIDILSDGRVLFRSPILRDSKIYDGRVKRWVAVPHLPVPRFPLPYFLVCRLLTTQMVELNNHVYMLEIDSYHFSSFNTSGNNFTPVQVQSPGCYGRLVTSDEFIYCVTDGSRGCKVFQYNPKTNVWSKVASTNYKVPICSSICSTNGFIYIFGGGNSKSASLFNLSTCVWSQIADMNVSRSNAGAIAVNGLIYAIGGNKCNDSIEIYDPQTNKWTLSKHKKKPPTFITIRSAIVLNPESNINAKNILDYYSNII